MFKSIRHKIYQIVAVLFLAVQSLVVCPLVATAVPIAQVNSQPAANEPQQPIATPDRTPAPQLAPKDRIPQPAQTKADQKTAKPTQPYDLDAIKKFDDELYGK